LILPYVEQGIQITSFKASTTPGGGIPNPNVSIPIVPNPQPVDIFLCPSRRTKQVGPKDDYAGVYTDSIAHWDPFTGAATGGNGDLDLIMGQAAVIHFKPIVNNGNVRLSDVTSGSGTSTTLLLGHKLMDPANYLAINGNNDLGFADYFAKSGQYEHMRWTDANDGGNLNAPADHGYIQDTKGIDANHMGGPHYNGAPVVYADGSVRMYPYLYISPTAYNGIGFTDIATFQALWVYNRSFTMTPP
jgi:prepilin-type processing-associated H-X9-DG protein